MNPDPSYSKGKVTGHFLIHWGVPKAIHEQSSRVLEFAVVEFHPNRFSDIYHFATNGMGSYLQSQAGETCVTRTELFVCASAPHSWIIKLLALLAPYPQQVGEILNEFDTFPVTEPLDRESSPFTALLLLPPMPPEAETLGAIPGVTKEPVLVHQVVGIYESERQFAIEHGSKALLKKLRAAECDFMIGTFRNRVA